MKNIAKISQNVIIFGKNWDFNAFEKRAVIKTAEFAYEFVEVLGHGILRNKKCRRDSDHKRS